MGFFSKPKTKITTIEPYPGAGGQMKSLADMAMPGAQERLATAGQPYTGQLVAPTSQYEQMGLENLGNYLNSPSPTSSPLYGAAQGELEKTLGGEEYDPVGGTYYQAYRTAVLRELQEAKDRLAAETSARDKYFGGGRIAATGELEETALNDLELMLGQLYENERSRRLSAVPMATDFLGAGEGFEQGRIAASQEYGALPREIEQAGLTAEYNEYIRQLQDAGIPLETAIALMTSEPTAASSTEQGEFWTLLPAIGPVVGAFAGAKMA